MAKGLDSKPHRDRLDRSRKMLDGQVVNEERSQDEQPATREKPKPASKETGGPDGLDPTRYGDWEKNGRCIDF